MDHMTMEARIREIQNNRQEAEFVLSLLEDRGRQLEDLKSKLWFSERKNYELEKKLADRAEG